MMNGGYEIIKQERFDSSKDGLREHYIVLGVMHGKFGIQYVTWQATLDVGVVPGWSYFWGHYYNDRNAALYDYHHRLADEYDYMSEKEA